MTYDNALVLGLSTLLQQEKQLGVFFWTCLHTLSK